MSEQGRRIYPPNLVRRGEVGASIKFGILDRTPETTFANFSLTAEAIRGKRILDVGGGFGRFAQEGTKLGAHIVRVDPLYDPYYRGLIQSSTTQDSLSYKHNAVAGMAQELPFLTNSFDLTLANHSFFWSKEYEQSVLEMFRVTRPMGSVRIFPGVHISGDLERANLPLGARVVSVGRGESMLEIPKTNIPPDQAAGGIKQLLKEVKISRPEIVKVLFPK